MESSRFVLNMIQNVIRDLSEHKPTSDTSFFKVSTLHLHQDGRMKEAFITKTPISFRRHRTPYSHRLHPTPQNPRPRLCRTARVLLCTLPRMHIFQGILLGCGALATSALTALYILQEKILYYPSIPSREYERTPDQVGLSYIDVDLLTEDNVKLHAWLIKQPESRTSPTFIYFHGNAGNISHRLPDVRFFFASGYNVLMVSYRGYGTSEGSPSEAGLRLDASAALSYLLDRSDIIDVKRIYIFGRSIGGACGIALAASPLAHGAIRGLIVENTFTSIDDMIDVVFPFLRFAKPFNRNKWNSLSDITKINVPILFMSGLQDNLVPPAHMEMLHESATNAPFVSFHTVAEGGHNDTWYLGGREYRSAMEQFLQRVESH